MTSGGPLADDRRAPYALLGAWAFGMAAYASGLSGALFAALGIAALAAGAFGRGGRSPVASGAEPLLVLQVAALGVVAPRLPAWPHPPTAAAVAAAAVATVVALCLVVLTRRSNGAGRGAAARRPLRALVLVDAVVLAVSGALILAAVSGFGDDVFLIHERAAAALARGASPYGSAVVVPDNSPFAAPGARIVGYTYPPPTLLAYAAGAWIAGDPRWTSLVAILVVVVALGARATRAGSDGAATSAIAACLLLASSPAWPRVLEEGWTEPVSLALFSASALVWARPWAASLALGCGLASKQYFALAAPAVVVALLRAPRGRLRAAVTFGSTVACLAPAALDLRSFWRAAVQIYFERPPRPDGTGLLGALARLTPIKSLPPGAGAAALLISSVVGAAAARRAAPEDGPWAAMALALATSFFLSQASPNYWFLAAGLSALAVVTAGGSHQRLASAGASGVGAAA
jgi:hypothetical protein